MSRILIYGGTFDPPHRAHIELAQRAAKARNCQSIVYIPAASNPLKQHQPTPGHHRVAMLHRALINRSDAVVSTIELLRPPPSYTIDTLRALRARLPRETELHLLLGSDAAATFYRWREPHAILELATPAVLLRNEHDPATLERLIAQDADDAAEAARWRNWLLTDLQQIDISATEIRAQLRNGGSPVEVPPAVMSYIRTHQLFE
ncbi:MAG: nicotinate (nicotinamide) nucleotide adenylyltransferase [Phycisphaerales bacterium]